MKDQIKIIVNGIDCDEPYLKYEYFHLVSTAGDLITKKLTLTARGRIMQLHVQKSDDSDSMMDYGILSDQKNVNGGIFLVTIPLTGKFFFFSFVGTKHLTMYTALFFGSLFCTVIPSSWHRARTAYVYVSMWKVLAYVGLTGSKFVIETAWRLSLP